ncbi:FHA domain-containing protein [Mycobacterium sp. Marseille-P9652]|uniref:FHA domain-containing protein n=1 Tax=Mycobacterium sp. Marseille-P9652 TaxID=2654950 RepID=UPI0012E9615D|nr:FHA domain-containing protein [Mycobacterium sp. Marseille-P9652]
MSTSQQPLAARQSHAADETTREIFDTSATVAEAAVEDLGTLASGLGVLVVKRGPNAGTRFRLEHAVMSAGRHPASDIFLDDITVSRRHAEFRKDDDRFRVVDLGSLNSTYVNREPVDSAVLANGDEVQIGNFRLVFLTGPLPE